MDSILNIILSIIVMVIKMKKISYILLNISYFLLGFILFYFNLINPLYEGSLGVKLRFNKRYANYNIDIKKTIKE